MAEKETASDKQPLVLVADDEPDIRHLLARFLSDRGFEVATAENGYDALGTIRRIDPDVLLLDISMPVMNGIELLRFAGDLQLGMPIVIAVSGVASEAEVSEVLRLGATDFFAKPVDLKSLLSCIESRLNEARPDAGGERR